MRERVRRRRVGEVVGRHVDRLHRRDRAGARRRDPLLQLAHLGRQRRLVADGARHAAEQRRDLGARLDEAEDVVDEEQHVLALVAEVLRHRQAGEADAQARARRLVHLAEDERDLVDHARLAHLEPEVVALARALADAGEDGDAAVLARDVVDQLLDQHGLADAGAAEEADLAALDVRRDQVDDLDPGLEDLDLRRQVAERRRIAMDRPALASPRRRSFSSIGSPSTFQRRPSVASPTGTEIGAPVSTTSMPRGEPVGRVHGDGAHAVVAEMLLHLGDELDRRVAVLLGRADAERAVDRGQAVGEDRVDHDALDLDDLADVLTALSLGMRLLEGGIGERSSPDEATGCTADSTRSPGALAAVAVEGGQRAALLLEHRHTGGVIELQQ